MTGEELGRKLFAIHSHAEIENEENPNKIVYTEEDILQLLRELGFPEVEWEESYDTEV